MKQQVELPSKMVDQLKLIDQDLLKLQTKLLSIDRKMAGLTALKSTMLQDIINKNKINGSVTLQQDYTLMVETPDPDPVGPQGLDHQFKTTFPKP